LARNKAIFDADILINTVKTKSLEYLAAVFEQIYVSDYVWNCEIREDSPEYPILKRLLLRRSQITQLWMNGTRGQVGGFWVRLLFDAPLRAPRMCLRSASAPIRVQIGL